jgi:hypothetical protein
LGGFLYFKWSGSGFDYNSVTLYAEGAGWFRRDEQTKLLGRAHLPALRRWVHLTGLRHRPRRMNSDAGIKKPIENRFGTYEDKR